MRAAIGGFGRLALGVLLAMTPLDAAVVGAEASAQGVDRAADTAPPSVETAPDQAKPDADKPAVPEAPSAVAPAPAPGTPKNLLAIFPGEATSILGKKVQGAAGEDMGRIVDILVDADGQPRAAVIDFGGFLGVGSRKIAVDWRLLKFRPADRQAPVQLSVTRDEVQAAPEYKEKNQPAQVVVAPVTAPTAPDDAK